MFIINVTDELGEHDLHSNRDCTWICHHCGHERRIMKKDINENNKLQNPKCVKCKEIMTFSYWLDCIYDEEELNEMEENK